MDPISIEAAGLVVGNVGALIWGAATLKSAVNGLERTTARLDVTLQDLAVIVHRHSAEIAGLKARWQRFEENEDSEA